MPSGITMDGEGFDFTNMINIINKKESKILNLNGGGR